VAGDRPQPEPGRPSRPARNRDALKALHYGLLGSGQAACYALLTTYLAREHLAARAGLPRPNPSAVAPPDILDFCWFCMLPAPLVGLPAVWFAFRGWMAAERLPGRHGRVASVVGMALGVFTPVILLWSLTVYHSAWR
jgi:hypothetical protein